MRRRIDRAIDRIEFVCLHFPMRIAEGCMSLMLVALAAYVADERVSLAGLIDAPPYTPIWAFTAALVLTCAAHLSGILMPITHRWLERRGIKQEWLTRPVFDDLAWRRWCCILAIVEWGVYSGVVSRLRWTAWLFCIPYSLLMSAAYIRLGGMRDARAGATDADIATHPERDRRRRHGPDAPADLPAAPPLERACG